MCEMAVFAEAQVAPAPNRPKLPKLPLERKFKYIVLYIYIYIYIYTHKSLLRQFRSHIRQSRSVFCDTSTTRPTCVFFQIVRMVIMRLALARRPLAQSQLTTAHYLAHGAIMNNPGQRPIALLMEGGRNENFALAQLSFIKVCELRG